jgi:hypothetical protein
MSRRARAVVSGLVELWNEEGDGHAGVHGRWSGVLGRRLVPRSWWPAVTG